MGKVEILMLISGVILSIALALIVVPMFNKSEDVITKKTIFVKLKYIRDKLELQKTLYGNDIVKWPQNNKSTYYALNYPFDFTTMNTSDFMYTINEHTDANNKRAVNVSIMPMSTPKLTNFLLNNKNMDFLEGLCDNRKDYLLIAKTTNPNYSRIREDKTSGSIICIMDIGLKDN